jgi:hypothetical protein
VARNDPDASAVASTMPSISKIPDGWTDITGSDLARGLGAVVCWTLKDESGECLDGFDRIVYVDADGDLTIGGGGKAFSHWAPVAVVRALLEAFAGRLAGKDVTS